MATALIVRKSCDSCKMTTDEEDGTIETVPWSWDGQPYEVDLCGGCKDNSQGEALETIIQISRPGGGKKAKKRKSPTITYGEFPCRDRKCKRVFTTAQGRGRHETVHPALTKSK